MFIHLNIAKTFSSSLHSNSMLCIYIRSRDAELVHCSNIYVKVSVKLLSTDKRCTTRPNLLV